MLWLKRKRKSWRRFLMTLGRRLNQIENTPEILSRSRLKEVSKGASYFWRLTPRTIRKVLTGTLKLVIRCNKLPHQNFWEPLILKEEILSPELQLQPRKRPKKKSRAGVRWVE